MTSNTQKLLQTFQQLPAYDTSIRLFYSERFVKARDIFFLFLVASYGLSLANSIYSKGPSYFFTKLGSHIKRKFYSFVLAIPYLNAQSQAKLEDASKKMEALGDFFPADEKWCKVLPQEGTTEEELITKLRELAIKKEVDWESGKVSGSVYRAQGDDDEKVLTEVMRLYGLSNILHPDMFPSVNKMEREIVAMVSNLYHAPPGAAGCFTMGGTESIIMACRTYKQQAAAEKGVTRPEMIVPITAHAAFDKAAEYFGIELVHIPMGSDFRVDLKAVKKAINRNTIMIVGSAMNYPHGIIDDITELSKLAKANRIGLHVDCCLGGFLVPFMEEAGFSLPPFDFRLDGVTSISCDTHKYGCTIKGSSVVIYRSQKLFSHQFHLYPDWTGGIYATHSIQGSRPGVLVAACWSALMRRGHKFYVQQAKEVVGAAMAIKEGARQIPGIEVIGNPLVSVVAFRGTDPSINTLNIADAMSQRGWALNKLQHPPSFHLACTARTVSLVPSFLTDLREATHEVVTYPERFNSESTAFYGANADMSGTGLNNQLLSAYLVGLLKF